MTELTASVAEVRAQFSKLASLVNETGQPITVFKNSNPWAKIAPIVDTYVDAIDDGLEKGFSDYKAGRCIEDEQIDEFFDNLRKRNG